MSTIVLYENGAHKNVLLEDYTAGSMVQSNQHLIVHESAGLLLDPGGHKIYSRALAECTSQLHGKPLTHIFLSHQDPDIVASVNGWLMTTDADAYISKLWTRFLPHFGVDRLVEARVREIPDEGMVLDFAGIELLILPAHFLHSCGNFHLYDPVSKILYSGDLGASLGEIDREVHDFEAHISHMEGFHKRYMASGQALRAWAAMVRTLDIECIAPQHGAVFRGKDMVEKFLTWCEGLQCGIDLLIDKYRVPRAG